MKATSSSIYRWRIGEIEITRVLEFETSLFEPAVIYPVASVSEGEGGDETLQPAKRPYGLGRPETFTKAVPP
jgi:hypothetical protein